METNVIYETFIKGIQSIHDCQLKTWAWDVHTKSPEDFVVDEDINGAWNEVSFQYSKVMHAMFELLNMVKTYNLYK